MNATPSASPMPGGAPAPSAAERIKQFITFTLGAQEYGVDIMMVREIKGWTETTALPHSPHYVRGVINLRGIIVPIIDLRARFDMGVTVPTAMHVVIIVTTGTRMTGLLVDTVSDILSINQSDIRDVPQLGSSVDEDLLVGLFAQEDRMVTLISLEGVIGADAGCGPAPRIN